MAFFKDDIITEKKEVKDTKTPGIKDLVSGNIITKEAISKQIPYIVSIAFIGILPNIASNLINEGLISIVAKF